MSIQTIASLPHVHQDGLPASGQVHIWYTFDREIHDPVLLARYEALLTPEERARHGRFVFAKDRHQFLVTRALVRSTLSRYAPRAPEAWRFVQNAYGKPEIAPAQMDASWQLSFNLSNTAGLIACAVAQGSVELGVDVEDMSRPGADAEIADRFFSPREAAALRALPRERQRERFFVYWTLKESYIKARGMGLSIPLEHFTFSLDRGIAISFAPELADTPGEWQFGLYRVSPSHLLALAVRRGAGPDCTVAASHCVPLVNDHR